MRMMGEEGSKMGRATVKMLDFGSKIGDSVEYVYRERENGGARTRMRYLLHMACLSP